METPPAGGSTHTVVEPAARAVAETSSQLETPALRRSLWFLPWTAAAVPFAFMIIRGFPAGDDWQLELARVAAYSHALADGQVPPFWAPHLYGGYGSPIFLFYGQVFLAPASLAALATGSPALGFVFALALASAVAIWSLQLAASALVARSADARETDADARPSDADPSEVREADIRSADAAAGRVVVYAFLLHPYLLADLLLRNAAAEYMALCLLPLALYGLLTRDARRGLVFLSVGSALVAAAHTLVALASSMLILPLAIYTYFDRLTRKRVGEPTPIRNDETQLRRFAMSFGLAVALSAFAWLPVLCFGSLIRTGDLLVGKFSYRLQFQPFAELFGFASRYGAGPLPLVAAIAGVFAWRHSRRAGDRLSREAILGRETTSSYTQRSRGEAPGSRSPIAALLIAFCGFVFVQTYLALPLWELLPGLAYFQFPWRFNGPLALVSALLAGVAFAELTRGLGARRRLQLELLILGICACGALPQLMRMRVVDAAELSRFEHMLEADSMQRMLVTSTVGDEYLPKQARRDVITHPASEDLVVDATPGMQIAIRHVEPRALVFDVRAPTQPANASAEMCLARWAFPFWTVRVDGVSQPVSACTGGRLRVQLTAGKHHVEVTLSMPAARVWGLALSALASLLLLGWWRVTRSRASRSTK